MQKNMMPACGEASNQTTYVLKKLVLTHNLAPDEPQELTTIYSHGSWDLFM